MATVRSLEMRFRNASGSATIIRVPDPKAGLMAAEVEAAMNTIIAKNIFASSGGDLVAIDSARIVERTTANLIGE